MAQKGRALAQGAALPKGPRARPRPPLRKARFARDGALQNGEGQVQQQPMGVIPSSGAQADAQMQYGTDYCGHVIWVQFARAWPDISNARHNSKA